jgi:hypothetical protein
MHMHKAASLNIFAAGCHMLVDDSHLLQDVIRLFRLITAHRSQSQPVLLVLRMYFSTPFCACGGELEGKQLQGCVLRRMSKAK